MPAFISGENRNGQTVWYKRRYCYCCPSGRLYRQTHFYDAEIIQMTAGTIGYTPEFVKKNEEIMTNSLLYDLVNQMYLNTDRMKRRGIKFSRQNARLYAILRKKAIA